MNTKNVGCGFFSITFFVKKIELLVCYNLRIVLFKNYEYKS